MDRGPNIDEASEEPPFSPEAARPTAPRIVPSHYAADRVAPSAAVEACIALGLERFRVDIMGGSRATAARTTLDSERIRG